MSISDINEEEIWEDLVNMIGDNVENHSLSAFDIAILLLSSTSPTELRGYSQDSKVLNFNQVMFY